MNKTTSLLLVALLLVPASGIRADVKLPAIFGDHMVLQRDMAVPVWGWDKPGTKVTVSFAGKEYTATAGSDGRWMVKLDGLRPRPVPPCR